MTYKDNDFQPTIVHWRVIFYAILSFESNKHCRMKDFPYICSYFRYIVYVCLIALILLRNNIKICHECHN